MLIAQNMRGEKVKARHYTKAYYFGYIVLYILSLHFLVDLAKLFAFYVVNHSLGIKKASIGKGTKVHASVVIREGENVIIGENCMINHNNVLQGGKQNAKIILGDYVQTGPGVMMFAFNHSTEHNGIPMIEQDYYEADIIIDKDVWIGAGSVITAGVHIGEGCVIGSGSVVTKDLPPYTICVGSPCKPIKERF